MICPFCSLLCDADDLKEVCCGRRDSSLVEVGKIRVWHGSPNRDSDLTLLTKPESCFGEPCYTESISKAVISLNSATRVLVTGRIASVQTARAAVAFAAKYNATIDCAEGGHTFKNVLAIQRSGFNSVSLAEARDLSDMLIVIGDDQLLTRTPRMPLALANGKGDKRTVLLLGDFNESSMSIWRDAGFDVWFVPCDMNAIPTALAQWSRWSESHCETLSATGPLFERLAQAKYTTVVWSAENLQFENADLWVERLLQWIATRNEIARCAALPWSSLDGTFQQVCTWLTGFPGRIAFRDGTPEYDPFRFAYMEWIAKRPASEKVKSVVVVIDETASATPFLDACDLQADMEILAVTAHSSTFPTAIAGVEVAADMFRADQTLLARVEPSVEPRPDTKSAAHWLEALS
jgi:formylmethanofuran dehydrogenase subunit B